MFGFVCGVTTTVVGAALVLVASIVGYAVVPGVIENMVVNELVLIEDTIQMERFEDIPFPLNFTVRIWNISNVDEVLAGGVPVMKEVGPYMYKVYQTRDVSKLENDKIYYKIKMNFEFDAELSFPHTEDDMVTITNVAYHAILQVAESMFPGLMPALNLAINDIFGEHNGPIMIVRVGNLLMEGIKLCENTGVIGGVACSVVRTLSEDTQNIAEDENGNLLFSLLAYRNGIPSPEYVVHRGLEEHSKLARIVTFDGRPHLLQWQDGDGGRGSGVCNMINGTDSGVFAPFINSEESIYALNTDICRSVELRYQEDVTYEGIPAKRFTLNEWFLDNNEECFCLNRTHGINKENGCLLRGASEMYTCVGAFLVLSYPHFLYADQIYQNGVIGINPNPDKHRIYLDIEPITGTVVRGFKRAQFNIFMRPVNQIPATQTLRTSLTPIVWIEEGMSLPEEYVNEITSKLLMPLNVVSILIPVLIAVSCVVFLLGVAVIIRALKKTPEPVTSTPVENRMPRVIAQQKQSDLY